MQARRALRGSAAVAGALLVVVTLGGCGPSQRERDLNASNQQLSQQVDQLRSDLAAATSARDKAEQAEATARQERDTALKELADAEAHAALVGDERDATDRALAAARADLATATQQRDAALQALQDASAKLQQLQGTDAGAAAVGAAPTDPLKAALDAANTRADDAEAQVAALKTRLAEDEKKLVAASDELAQLTQERDASQRTRSALDAQSVEQANTIATQSQRIEALQTENTALKAQLAQTRQQSGDLQQALRQTSGDLQASQDEAARLTGQLEALVRSHQGLQDLSQAQRTELDDVRMRLEQAQSEVARLTGARGIYTVQPADSLSSIAEFFYRDGYRWPAIFQANAHLIDDPDMIFPGMVLIVPSLEGTG